MLTKAIIEETVLGVVELPLHSGTPHVHLTLPHHSTKLTCSKEQFDGSSNNNRNNHLAIFLLTELFLAVLRYQKTVSPKPPLISEEDKESSLFNFFSVGYRRYLPPPIHTTDEEVYLVKDRQTTDIHDTLLLLIHESVCCPFTHCLFRNLNLDSEPSLTGLTHC